jgi:hypothetical protein
MFCMMVVCFYALHVLTGRLNIRGAPRKYILINDDEQYYKTKLSPPSSRRELAVFIDILNAISESMGKGLEYNLNLIDDPGATLAKVTSITRLTYPQTRRYLQLLADQELVSIGIYRRKRRTRKKGREIKRRLTVTTVKITDKGYKYLLLKEE